MKNLKKEKYMISSAAIFPPYESFCYTLVPIPFDVSENVKKAIHCKRLVEELLFEFRRPDIEVKFFIENRGVDFLIPLFQVDMGQDLSVLVHCKR